MSIVKRGDFGKDFIPIFHRYPYSKWKAKTPNSEIIVVNEPLYRRVYVHHLLLLNYPTVADEYNKVAVVLLDYAKVLPQYMLGQFFGIHVNSICNWKKIFNQVGPSGLACKRAPGKNPEKTAQELELYVVAIWNSTGPEDGEQNPSGNINEPEIWCKHLNRETWSDTPCMC